MDVCLFGELSGFTLMLQSLQVNDFSLYFFGSLYWTIGISDGLFPKSYYGFEIVLCKCFVGVCTLSVVVILNHF